MSQCLSHFWEWCGLRRWASPAFGHRVCRRVALTGAVVGVLRVAVGVLSSTGIAEQLPPAARVLTQVPEDVGTAWAHAKLGDALPVWHIFDGEHKRLPPLIEAAMASCDRFFASSRGFQINFVLSNESERWLSRLHPLFMLLSKVHRSDYLRQELLYEYGGVYMDSDVACLKDISPEVRRVAAHHEVGTWRHDDHNYGTNAMGPMRRRGPFMAGLHRQLWASMDRLTAKLRMCQVWYPDGAGGVAYPLQELAGNTHCGVGWGDLMDPGFPIFGAYKRSRPDLVGEVPRHCSLHCGGKFDAGLGAGLPEHIASRAETVLRCDSVHLCGVGRAQHPGIGPETRVEDICPPEQRTREHFLCAALWEASQHTVDWLHAAASAGREAKRR